MGADAPSPPARRPAAFGELQELHSLWAGVPSVRTWASLLIGSGVAAIVGAVAALSPGPALAAPIMYTGFGLAAGLFAAFLAAFVRRIRRSMRVRTILKDADPALTPAAPLTEGDRFGGWVTLEADAGRLHLARAQSLAAFRVARAGALLTAVALLGSTLAFVIGRLWSGNIKIPMTRALVGAVVGATWLARFAFARSAYQWTIEDGELTLQDAALFGPSRLKTVAAAQVQGFEADPRELRIRLDDGTTRPLAGLGGGPLAGWRAASVATTVAILMDLRTTLTFTDDLKRATAVAVPSAFADAADLSASTSGLLSAEQTAA